MPLQYDLAASGPLRQGEILADVHEHRVEAPAASLSGNDAPKRKSHTFTSVKHPLTVVLSPACDLDQHYGFHEEGSDKAAFALSHVILLDLYSQSDLRTNPAIVSNIFDRIKKNQDERYHCLPAAEIGSSGQSLPQLFVDFKRAFSLPIDSLYTALESGLVRRRAIVPPVYVHDLIQRFYSFLARIGVPD